MGFENVAPGDPRLNDYGALREPELLHGRGLFIAEGRLVVRRAIDGGRYRLRSVLVSEAARRSLEPELARLAPDILPGFRFSRHHRLQHPSRLPRAR